MKVLYASGYAADTIADRRVLELGIAFLPKPMTPDVLAGKVREVLDSPAVHGSRELPANHVAPH